jgi:hypothetical protein
MLGIYDNFPLNIHRTESFTSPLSRKKLQQKIAQIFQKINQETLTFEEVGNPTIPNSQIIFEFGIADGGNFCYLNEEEAQKLQNSLTNESLQTMDWFCLIRYYKNTEQKVKRPLKFDYYMLRIGFGEKGIVELQVFHERGPRYISPEDLVAFIARKVNGLSARKTLKQIGQD